MRLIRKIARASITLVIRDINNNKSLKCQFCNQELPEGAKFCFNCNKQIVCLECGNLLIENSSICVYCGKEIKTRSTQSNVNHIKYSETEKGKSFEASFSDETAGNVVDVFAQFMPIKRNQHTQQHQPLLQSVNSEDADAEEIKEQPKESSPQNNSNTTTDINKIFISKNDTIAIYEKRLKAKSKSDYQARACLLFLLYMKQSNNDIKREELVAFLKKENLNDGNYRAWFSQHKSYFVTGDGTIELSPEGEEKAKEILNEVFDSAIEDTWKPNSGSVQGAVSKPSSKQRNPQFVKDLNLSPNGKESLENYMGHYTFGASSPQINLLFVYYLKHILKLDNITQDHVFTCYRSLKIKLPNNLYKSLSNTISRNGWLSCISNLEVTSIGIRFLTMVLLDL